ncbi:MAG: trypsin-like serine protease, partial [Proteobacteria bacterium]
MSIESSCDTVMATDANSTRRTVSMTVAQLDSIDIVYKQSTKGICSGDSGGPIVAGGKVVGIHSRVQGQSQQQLCNGTAYSVRVSAVLPFIDGVVASDVASPPAAVDSCDRCVRNSDYGDTVCRQKRDRCTANADCGKLLTCLQEAGASSSKQSACFTANPKAQGMLFDYYACSCNDLCTAECSTNASCQDWAEQKCGSIGLGDLASCVESTCCTEMDEAAADPVAFACLTGSSTAGCASNALFVAANACIEACDTGASSSSGGKASSSGASGTSGEAGEGEPEAEGDDDGTRKSN